MLFILCGQWSGVPPGLRCHVQHICPPTSVRCVWGDVAAIGGVHVVFQLTDLEP